MARLLDARGQLRAIERPLPGRRALTGAEAGRLIDGGRTDLMLALDDKLISADSHVYEPPDLWRRTLGARFGEAAPLYAERKLGGAFQAHEGGWDPAKRGREAAADGVSSEIL